MKLGCSFAILLLSLMASASAQTGPVVWVARSLERVGPDDPARSGLRAEIRAARGEYESFQIIVKAPASSVLSDVNVIVSDLSGPGGRIIPKQNITLFREHYVYVGTSSPDWGGSNRPMAKGWYPDGLIPFVDPQTGLSITSASLKAVPFSLAVSKNQPIWVDVFVPRNAEAGYYNGTFTVTTAQGSVTGQIGLTVWNFTLPLKPSLKSSFLYWSAGSTPAIQELLRNRLNPERTPTSAQRAMIDNFGLASQETGYWSGADIGNCTMAAPPSVSQLRSTASAQQSDLMLYNYSADEIDKCTNLYPTMKQWAVNLHQAGIKNLVTMAPVPELMDDGSGTGRSAVDIWVMLPVVYDHSSANVRAAQAKGDEAWSYNCLVQDAYSPKWMIDFAPINFRVQPGFINQSLGLKGLLYWRIDHWSSDPWNNVYAPGFSRYPGEAILVYPGSTVGIQGVAPSMRLKWLRDGADDYEYIELLRQAGQGSSALAVAAGVGANWSQWTKDIDALENARLQLGTQLDQLGGGDTSIPGTPVSPSPASGSTGVSLTPSLTWGASSGTTSYDVYFGTSASPGLAGSTAGTGYYPGTLSANTTYYWRVVAKNSAGSASSATWSFTTLTPAPGAPASPSPASGSTGVPLTASLAWGAVNGATSYDVYFGTSASPGLAGSTAGTGYNPGTLSANTTYYWRVVAKNSAGSASSATWSFTTLTPAPSAPANPSPASGSTGVSLTPSLAWGAATGATSYDVYFGTSASPGLVGSTTGTGYNPGTLSAETTYYWRVVAKNSAGSTSSGTWSFKTAAAASDLPLGPVSVTPSSGAGLIQTFTFTFSAPKGLQNANVLINSSASGQNACWFNYNAPSRSVSLASNNSSSWSYAALGSATTLQNSQCALQVGNIRVTSSGSQTTLIVPVNFSPSFAGTRNIYLRLQDTAGTMTSFTRLGSWIVR
ncbi:MAG: glycoside hydrolase domain-containing protein [Bryobacteraceae bacterium]